MSRLLLRAAGALILLGSLFLSPLHASAHEGVEAGSYVLTIGWNDEPVIVGQPNGLYLFIAPKEGEDHSEEEGHSEGEEGEAHHEGVTAAEGTLEFTVKYGSASQSYDLRPVSGEPGRYTATFIPTREGQYTFQFTGAINGEAVELAFEPEEVEAPGKLAFPEAPPSTIDLLAQLSSAQSQARTAQMIGVVGVILGLIGTGIGVYSLTRKR
jgi:hypothetical protein